MLEAAEPQAAQRQNHQERGSSQAHVEQRPRTWIIKLSCVLITPSKRPGRSQEATQTLRMMRLISQFFCFFFAKELLSCRDGCAGPSLKHGSRQIKTFCTSEITLLRLTRKTQRTDVVTVWIIRCSILPSGNQICRSFASEQRCDSKTCIVVHRP